jgi:hypothetical protein
MELGQEERQHRTENFPQVIFIFCFNLRFLFNFENNAIRFFEAEPKAKEKFASFANINHFDLPTNSDFLAQAERCVSNLDAYVEHVGEDPKRCPFVAKAKGKYHSDDLKVVINGR